MSSTTENLGLTLPAGSEWADVTVLNENWEKIDRQVLRAMAAAADYDQEATYQKGDFCTQGGLLYRANQTIAQPEEWTTGHWTAISITDVIRGLTATDVGAIPTTQKGTAGGVATLESDSQIPYSQTPHLTGNMTLYVDATSGSDTNSGTQQSPFATIGAALNSLPRDFGGRDVKIQLAQGRYDEQVNIKGFHNGNLEINGDSKNANLYYVRTISATAIPRLKVVGISTSYINGYIVQSLDVGDCNFEKVTDNTGLLSSFGSNATLYKVDFKNYGDAAISVWSGGRLSAGSCTGSGNAVGIKVNSGDGFPGFAILNNCNFGATTEIQKNYSSIVFKDGVQV